MSKYSFKDYDNSSFYNSKAWKRTSRAYMLSQNYICERCGKPAAICHHKKWLNGRNVKDPSIALDHSNLEALCIDCHNAEHSLQHSVTLFNSDGSIANVKESQAAKEFKQATAEIDKMLAMLQKNDPAEAPQSDEKEK